MDALDVKILRNLGTKPFSRWPREVPGLKPSAIARWLGKNVPLINGRIARMEKPTGGYWNDQRHAELLEKPASEPIQRPGPRFRF